MSRMDTVVPARARGSRAGAMRWLRVVLLALVAQSAPVSAATIFDVDKILTSGPHVTTQGKVVTLQDGGTLHHVRVDQLQNLADVHKRIGAVSKVQANLALAIERQPNARAIPMVGRNVILVSTSMLELLGTDPDMAAALLGHEYAHLYMKHSLRRVATLPDLVYGAVAVGNAVEQSTGNSKAALSAAQTAFGRIGASFSREQEVEADRVGTELMSSAKFNPDGTLRLMNVMLKVMGARPTGYFDSHPGFEERIAKAAPTVLNQRFDSVAVTLMEAKNWKSLSRIVDQWLTANPDSARAWYYRGAVLKASSRDGALEAFKNALRYDPYFLPGRVALCVELYSAGREMESLICSEHIPRGELRDQYVAQTFRHPVYVGGMNEGRPITALDVMIVQQLMQASPRK